MRAINLDVYLTKGDYRHAQRSRDVREADEALAREIYLNLPTVAEPDGLSEEKLNAEEMQLFARAINPESRFWDASAWTRVTDLERERRR